MIQNIIAEKIATYDEKNGYKVIKRCSWLLILDILISGKISYTISILNFHNITDNIIKYINSKNYRISLSTFFVLELLSFYDPESSISMISKKKMFDKLYENITLKPKFIIYLWKRLIYKRTFKIVTINNNSKYYFGYY